MQNEKVCPNCNEAIEDGAAYCGNCGQKLTVSSFQQNGYRTSPSAIPTASPVNATAVPVPRPNVPAYTAPHSHHKQHYAALALAFGLLGGAVAFMIPILGIAFGIIGIMLLSLSFRITHGWLRSAGLAVPILAVLVGIGFSVHYYSVDKTAAAAPDSTTNTGTAMINVKTPCFNLTFSEILNVDNTKGSCNINAYNDNTFVSSSDVYTILAEETTDVNVSNFVSLSKAHIEEDITDNLQGFTITKSASTLFADSQAYYAQAYDSSKGISLIEETIYHPDNASTDNYYDIIHAVNGQSTNLNEIEENWQWND